MAQTVFLGDHELTFPGPHLGVLRDCNAVLDSAGRLQKTDSGGRVSSRSRLNRLKKKLLRGDGLSLNTPMETEKTRFSSPALI